MVSLVDRDTLNNKVFIDTVGGEDSANSEHLLNVFPELNMKGPSVPHCTTFDVSIYLEAIAYRFPLRQSGHNQSSPPKDYSRVVVNES